MICAAVFLQAKDDETFAATNATRRFLFPDKHKAPLAL
jgi:hypothetical protein